MNLDRMRVSLPAGQWEVKECFCVFGNYRQNLTPLFIPGADSTLIELEAVTESMVYLVICSCRQSGIESFDLDFEFDLQNVNQRLVRAA